MGPPPWRIVAALVFVAALVVALVAVGGSDEASSGPAATSTSTSVAIADVPVTTVVETVTPTTQPQDGQSPSTVTSGDDTPPGGAPLEDAEGDLAAALEAWGLFAATGDISAVAGFFAPSGPQYAQLVSEVEDRVANAPGLPAFDFVMEQPTEVARTEGSVVYRGEVRIERPGVEPEVFLWDVEMRREPDTSRWLLWTVSSAGQ